MHYHELFAGTTKTNSTSAFVNETLLKKTTPFQMFKL